jgi:cell division protein FtsB
MRVVLPLVFLAVAAFLYVRPLSDYSKTKADLAARQRAVASLRHEKAELTRQLARTTDLGALERQARSIGYLRPGEQLFIVKGIPEWRRAHRPHR